MAHSSQKNHECLFIAHKLDNEDDRITQQD